MSGIRIDVEIDGKFFTQGPEIIAEAKRDAIAEIVETGASEAKDLASSFRKTGAHVESLRGRVAKTGKSGRVKSYGKVAKTYAGKLERGDGKSFKGYHTLGNTRTKMQGGARGILDKHVDAAVRKLNS